LARNGTLVRVPFFVGRRVEYRISNIEQGMKKEEEEEEK
jgi:hypothetical protein